MHAVASRTNHAAKYSTDGVQKTLGLMHNTQLRRWGFKPTTSSLQRRLLLRFNKRTKNLPDWTKVPFAPIHRGRSSIRLTAYLPLR